MRACMCVGVGMRVCVCVCTYVHVCVHMCMHACVGVLGDGMYIFEFVPAGTSLIMCGSTF